MEKERSDALVFFGASGDLAYKKIFPALQAMARRGKLDCLVIGVAKSSWVAGTRVSPYRRGRTYEDYLGMRGFGRLGRKKWTRHVREVVDVLKGGLQADYVVLGGGQTKKLKTVPPGVRTSDNLCAIRGGRRLWDAPEHRRRPSLVTGSNRF